MSQVLISSNLDGGALAIKGVMSGPLLHTIAEAFTPGYNGDEDNMVHAMLISIFGKRTYVRYALDLSDVRCRITFSNNATPRVLSYQGAPMAIAAADAADFELFVQEVDLIKPGRMHPDAVHPYTVA